MFWGRSRKRFWGDAVPKKIGALVANIFGVEWQHFLRGWNDQKCLGVVWEKIFGSGLENVLGRMATFWGWSGKKN